MPTPQAAGTQDEPQRSLHRPALIGLYTLEGFLALVAAAINKNGERPLSALIGGPFSTFFLIGLCGALAAAVALIAFYRRGSRRRRREFMLTAWMNAATLLVIVAAGEGFARVLTAQTPEGSVMAGELLLPRRWDEVVAAQRAALESVPNSISYFVADEVLGWTIGPNRQSKNGLYLSSQEGIRSDRAGMSYADRHVSRRIAVVGDSFSFGLEVPFAASWPAQLKERLGPATDVLNFGVDGYGVDQAYLRYSKDVRKWRPDVVILAFIQHDLTRSMTVYSFLSFPDWNIPFGKPRMVTSDGGVRALNVPIPSPREILATPAVDGLPFIEYDAGYYPAEWRWHWNDHSALFRFLLTRFRSWPIPNAHATVRAATTLNGEILAAFVREATRDGSRPIVVYLPARNDMRGGDLTQKDDLLAFLRQRGIAYHDLTSCLSVLPEAELFNQPGAHYSPAGNAAVAKCLVEVVNAT